MTDPLKAAVVGCGGAARVNHIPWYNQNPDVQLVALVDNNPKAQEKVTHWNIPFYTGLTDMLNREKPDLVSVATPVHLHLEHTRACLDHGCHVLCEKPLAPSLDHCQKMIDHAEQKNKILGVGLDKRFSLVFDHARKLIQGGKIGTAHFARAHLVMSQYWIGTDFDPGFRGQVQTGGGAFQDLGSHYLDITAWLIDQPITAVQGQINIRHPHNMHVEDHAVALLQFQRGATGLIETSWVGPMHPHQGHIEELWVYGTDGAVKILGAQRLELPSVAHWDRKTRQWHLIPIPSDPGGFSHCQYKRMIDQFVACVKTNTPFAPDATVGKTTAAVVLAVYLAAHTRQQVAVPLAQDPPLDDIFHAARDAAT